jgi:hypothetical protein
MRVGHHCYDASRRPDVTVRHDQELGGADVAEDQPAAVVPGGLRNGHVRVAHDDRQHPAARSGPRSLGTLASSATTDYVTTHGPGTLAAVEGYVTAFW